MGQGESVNYKSTVAGDPLSIPPDLTQANRDAHYRAPEGATSYSVYSQGQTAQQAKGGADTILPQSDAIKVMRDGDLRWLVVDRPVEDLFPRIVDFWGEHGFTIQSQDPRAGLIQTDWAENRAKIPESWIRSALGSIIDQVFDSGERDRFRTRFERVGNKTEIYVSHQHMEETPTADGSAFKWVFAKEDPGLNAAMLARMMVFLGSDIETAREQVANASKDPSSVQVQASDKGDQAELMLNESFDRAWRRVGVAIDSAGFSVEDRDRSAGEFFIRYLDSDTGEKIEQQKHHWPYLRQPQHRRSHTPPHQAECPRCWHSRNGAGSARSGADHADSQAHHQCAVYQSAPRQLIVLSRPAGRLEKALVSCQGFFYALAPF